MPKLCQRFTLIFSDVQGKRKGEGAATYSLRSTAYSLLMILTFHFLLLTFSVAQTADDVINLAASHSAFARALADRPGWTARTYNTKNDYGIWRVEFQDAEGNYLGYSDVNPEKQLVYAWQTEFDLLDGQYAEAEEALLNFARQDPTVISMIGNIDERNGQWFGFDAWRNVWVLYIDRWPNASVELNFRSSSTTPRSLENLYLEKVLVQDVMSYDDWHSASASQAVQIAFTAPEIAAAVRDQTWTTHTEHIEGNTWKIHFMSGETELAEADVDVNEGSLLRFTIQ